MDAPRIQYARTSDGVSIAFWTLGEGAPIIYLPPVPLHLEAEWRVPWLREWYERLAARWRIVRFDIRNSGLSGRGDAPFSIESRILDLDAVIQRLSPESFTIFAGHHSTPSTIVLGARKISGLKKLILWCPYALWNPGVSGGSRGQTIETLRGIDWEIFTETVGLTYAGSGHPVEAQEFAALLRESLTHADAIGPWAQALHVDVREHLAAVLQPSLILGPTNSTIGDGDLAWREVAARIPNAQMSTLEGSCLLPQFVDTHSLIRAVGDFLGEGESASSGGEKTSASVRTILFTDIESHTQMMQRLGDAKGREVLRQHERITREALAAHGGAEVKTMGDGFMASFGSVQKAVECAVALQKAFAAKNDEPVRIRVGINAGEPIAEDADLFGSSVILAARTAAKAQGGEILVTDVVRQLVAGKGFVFADRGETEMRGFEEPVRLYEVRWT